MKSHIAVWLLAVCLGWGLAFSQETPRLTEPEVCKLADTKVPFAELALYDQRKPLYVSSAKAWQVDYVPKHKKDAQGKKIERIGIWVDDATGNVSRSR